MGDAIGLIEAIGFSTAIAAVDAATKAANVTCIGYERVIGVGKAISITAKLEGDVAAVQAAVLAGKAAGEKIGTIVSTHVIPRPHSETRKIIASRETLTSIIQKPKGKSAKSVKKE